jgi:hypothetical protein
MTRMVWGFAVLAVLHTLSPPSAVGADFVGLEKFAGHWSCAGTFSNGALIAGEIFMEADSRSGALIVHHDDLPPGAYHALEVWSVSKNGTGFKASISDVFSGMRWFESMGWQGDTLTWVRSDGTPGSEQFVYQFLGAGEMQVRWLVAHQGALKVGDTLKCTK